MNKEQLLSAVKSRFDDNVKRVRSVLDSVKPGENNDAKLLDYVSHASAANAYDMCIFLINMLD